MIVLSLNQLLHITQSFEEMDSTTAALVKHYAKQKHPGCKKNTRPIRSSIANRYVRPKTLISVEAKKLLIKNLLE